MKHSYLSNTKITVIIDDYSNFLPQHIYSRKQKEILFLKLKIFESDHYICDYGNIFNKRKRARSVFTKLYLISSERYYQQNG